MRRALTPTASAERSRDACALRHPPLARQPCWGAPELKRRSGTHRAYTLAEKLRRGATSSDGAAIFPSEAGQELKAELDDLLDEIDDVLETNAEEFVKNYVQKGGQ